MLGHQHNEGIHQQGEPAALPCPRHFDLFNTAFLAFRARDTTVQIGLELKEIQVTPSSLDCIMNVTSRLTAKWARKLASCLEINVKVQLPLFNIKVDCLDIPRLFQTESYLEKFFLGD